MLTISLQRPDMCCYMYVYGQSVVSRILSHADEGHCKYKQKAILFFLLSSSHSKQISKTSPWPLVLLTDLDKAN